MSAPVEGAAPRATPAQWVEGARPRTLPAAVSPVVAATGVAAYTGGADLPVALLALLVSLALQVGVNFANDYSDGIRGTDAVRVGPLRLVGSGLARPATVRAAAFACFALAGVAGLALVVLTGHWWLLAVGVACVLAAWYYTGGRRPYGYAGLGEVFVFVFFGLVAVCGTGYVQTGHVDAALLLTAVWVGCLTTAVLVANNLRDLAGDAAVGKRTLATRLGDRGTRLFYVGLVVVAALALVGVAALTTAWVLLALLALLLLAGPVRAVLGGARGRDLIAVLKATGLAGLAASLVSALALVLA
ncbi:1,4-dihydroxy-2-naphthoate prenyltransferase [Microlunatus sagamiharensis]|uniref:1,4-dihydroxy-2-naphthoate octaprenyltransferase n=1 Tax=Microlunatus sagamiharensis TaxID=546874 RepID=A0A1H2MYJ6_9ACTN|nr:1,4-dihydroxy-2-naphthoate polyprenyltransferase [Microlunatus sagamiharensis]SDU98423.1 1,4-dihydroxy-2-naphthoate prenyltransferase [Microlunatus sagamiharensis]